MGNLLYTNGKFMAGVRYEHYLNVMQGFPADYKGTGPPRYRSSRSSSGHPLKSVGRPLLGDRLPSILDRHVHFVVDFLRREMPGVEDRRREEGDLKGDGDGAKRSRVALATMRKCASNSITSATAF